MSLFDSIFGSSPANQAMNSFASNQGIANSNAWTTQNQLANAYNQQLMNQYQMARNKPKWVYNGIDCDVNEFALLMWPDDEQARLMFILKHGGV
jgi:hypothetical protein